MSLSLTNLNIEFGEPKKEVEHLTNLKIELGESGRVRLNNVIELGQLEL